MFMIGHSCTPANINGKSQRNRLQPQLAVSRSLIISETNLSSAGNKIIIRTVNGLLRIL